jgi:ABC-type transport system involved in cytochrome bd biosynthesis fused ATPase/permease subunit
MERVDHQTHAAAAEVDARIVEYARLQPVLRAFGRSGSAHTQLDDALVAQNVAAGTQLAVVFQDVYLFDSTIRENIRAGRPSATDAEVLEAARLAQVDEIAARLPDGLDSRVGEGGTTLSGGERQRVSLARALIRTLPSCCSTRRQQRWTRRTRPRSAVHWPRWPDIAPCW